MGSGSAGPLPKTGAVLPSWAVWAHWARLRAPTARTFPQRHHAQGHQERKKAQSTRTASGTASPLNLAVSCPHFLIPKPSLPKVHVWHRVISAAQLATVHEGTTTCGILDSTWLERGGREANSN